MAANTGIVFSASVTAQMEATVGFSFTFGSFPEFTVPRNPASGSPTAGGNVVAGDRSDLTPAKTLPSTVEGPEMGFLGTVASGKLPKVKEKLTVASIWAVTLAEKTTLVLPAIELNV